MENFFIGRKVRISRQPFKPFLFVVPVGVICIVTEIHDNGFASIESHDKWGNWTGSGRLPIDCLEVL